MSLIEKLQHHYCDQLLSNQRLGELPNIADHEFNMQPQESQALLDWVLSQKWQYEQIKLYDGIYGLYSPTLILLSKMVRLRLGLHPTVQVDPENKVFLAHTCAVGIYCEKLPIEYFSYIVEGAHHGDPLLLAMDFTQWIGELELTEVVLKRITNVNVKDLLGSPYHALSNNLMDALEDNDEHGHHYCQWLQKQATQPWAHQMLSCFAYSTWYWNNSPHSSRPPQEVEKLNERSRRFLKIYSQSVFEEVLKYAKRHHPDAKYLDDLLSLVPRHIQDILVRDDFLDNQPHAQHLRFKQTLKHSIDGLGATSIARKI